MHGLGTRVGIEGFFLIVRNTSEFRMAPEWYFTSEALENYMPIATRKKWDTGVVGAKVEAFAVAGCDAVSAYKNFNVDGVLTYLFRLAAHVQAKGRLAQG
jgi:hypothetical protein